MQVLSLLRQILHAHYLQDDTAVSGVRDREPLRIPRDLIKGYLRANKFPVLQFCIERTRRRKNIKVDSPARIGISAHTHHCLIPKHDRSLAIDKIAAAHFQG